MNLPPGDASAPDLDAAVPRDGGAGTVSTGPLLCGSQACGDDAPICCVEKFVVYPETNPDSDFSCVQQGTQCALTYQCDSDGDCPFGTQCCGGYVLASGRVSYQCSSALACATAGIPLGCSQPSDCASPSQVCCGTLSSFSGGINSYYYTHTECVQSASCGDVNMRVFCLEDGDCPAASPACIPSTVLPGKKICVAASAGESS